MAGTTTQPVNDRFLDVYEKYKDALAQDASRSLPGKPALQDEVLQDTWVRVLTSLGKLRDENAVLPWLRSVLRSRIAERFKKGTLQLLESDIESPAMGDEEAWHALDAYWMLAPGLPSVHAQTLDA